MCMLLDIVYILGMYMSYIVCYFPLELHITPHHSRYTQNRIFLFCFAIFQPDALRCTLHSVMHMANGICTISQL